VGRPFSATAPAHNFMFLERSLLRGNRPHGSLCSDGAMPPRIGSGPRTLVVALPKHALSPSPCRLVPSSLNQPGRLIASLGPRHARSMDQGPDHGRKRHEGDHAANGYCGVPQTVHGVPLYVAQIFQTPITGHVIIM